MANRTRRHAGMPAGAKTDKPLVVIVTKKDLWGNLLLKEHAGGAVAMEFKNPTPDRPKCALRLDRIEEHSRRLRAVLLESAREIVEAAEGFASHVILYRCQRARPAAPPGPGHQHLGHRAGTVQTRLGGRAVPVLFAPDGAEPDPRRSIEQHKPRNEGIAACTN